MILEKMYNRENAVAYARKYALVRNPQGRPCVKGTVSLLTEGLFECEDSL